MSHHLDFYHPLRKRYSPDPCVRWCVQAESLSRFNRACGSSRDLGDHARTALDTSVIQGRLRAGFNKSFAIVIKPSGVPYDRMKPEELVIVDEDRRA